MAGKVVEISCKWVRVESEDGTDMTLASGNISIYGEELSFTRVNVKGRGYDINFRCTDLEAQDVHPYYDGAEPYNAINCYSQNGKRKCRIMFLEK